MFRSRLYLFAVACGFFLAVTTRLSIAEDLRMEDAVISVAATAGKPVVSISSEHTQKLKSRKRIYFSAPLGNAPFNNYDFFRKFFDEIPDAEFKRLGLGSGAIIDPNGYILTNSHVVEGADKITVTLSDGREFNAEVKGIDQRSDLAVIKINASGLPTAKLGDSDTLKIGQWVVAIGNPFGYAMQNPEPTVTAGVISALHRSLRKGLFGDRDFNDLIQTDAAINPGNSGGTLVNLKGEVVGINVAIFSTTGGYQGMGFAIPINNAKRILEWLIAGKKVVYGWLGITVQDLNDDLAKYFGLPDINGALVIKLLDNGPAANAGMKERDVIRTVDGQPVNSVKDLLNIVSKIEVGRKVKIVIVREKKILTLNAAIGERPEDTGIVSSAAGGTAENIPEKWRGIGAGELTPEIAQRLEIEESKGVVILEITPGSASENAGLSIGDIILEINKAPITNVSEYKNLIKSLKGNCLVRTQRGYFLVKDEKNIR